MNKKLWNEFLNGKLAINCRTENQAKKFLKYCEEQNLRWGDGSNPSRMTFWKNYKEKICYANRYKDYASIVASYKELFEKEGLKVITFKELTKTDEQPTKDKRYKGWEILKMIEEGELKEGDIIVCKTGFSYKVSKISCGIVITEINGLHATMSLMKFINDTFTIKERKPEYLTFDEARKTGTPIHKDTGICVPVGEIDELIKEMDKKVWEVKQ